MRTEFTRRWVGRVFLAGSLVAMGMSCRSAARVPEGPRLPFHVALIPTEVHDTSQLATAVAVPRWPDPDPAPVEDDMRLELTTQDVSTILREEMERAFVRTSLLALPTDPTLSSREHDQYWQARAQEVGADLLVRSRLQLDPEIDGARNEKFWLNLPLFLIGGPACWFVGDRRYTVSARLQVEVFDVSRQHETLEDFALLEIPLYSEARPTDLNFWDRSGGAAHFLFSFVVPAGLLARETAEVERVLCESVPRELGRDLAAKMLREREGFENKPSLGSFVLRSEELSVEPGPEGQWRVRVPLEELQDGGRLLRYELRMGLDGAPLAGDFGEVQETGLFFIDEEMPLSPEAEYVRLRITDSQARVRSYTLELPATAARE